MTAEFLWINVPLMALFFALWVGVPMWMIVKRDPRMPAQQPALAHEAAEHRELVLAGRS